MNRAAIDEAVADLIVAQARLEAVQSAGVLTTAEGEEMLAIVGALEELLDRLAQRKAAA